MAELFVKAEFCPYSIECINFIYWSFRESIPLAVKVDCWKHRNCSTFEYFDLFAGSRAFFFFFFFLNLKLHVTVSVCFNI